MKPPNLQDKKSWQRFFAGIAIGAIISWLMYVYMHGLMQEKQIITIEEQKKEIADLQRKIEIWEKDYEAKNEETEEKLTLEEIQVTVENYRMYKLDLLSVLETQDEIRKDLSSLISKDLETVYKGKSLIRKAIENKTIEINDKKYTFKVTEMMFYSNLSIEVQLIRL